MVGSGSGLWQAAAPEEARVYARVAVQDDLEQWLELRRGLWPERSAARHEAQVSDVLARRGGQVAFLCVDEATRVVGFAEARRGRGPEGGGPAMYLEALYVRPDARGQGAARRLVRALADWAGAHGCTRLVAARAPGDEAARRIAERLGLAETRHLVLHAAPVANTAPATGPEAPAPLSPAVSEPLVQAAREPPRRRRPVRLAVHVAACLLGVSALAYTDPWSEDRLRAVVLPLLDVAFIVYVVVVLAVRLYGPRRAASVRSGAALDAMATRVAEDAAGGADGTPRREARGGEGPGG